MASSGTFKNNFQTGYGLELDWRIVSQDTAANESVIEAELYWCSYGSSYTVNSDAKKPGYIKIDTGTRNFTEPNAGLNGNQRKLLDRYTRTVTHSGDGSKSAVISGRFDCQITLSGTYRSYVTVSGTAHLTQISRGRANIKVAGVWKSGQVWVKVGGTWKKATGVYTKVAGAWKRSI